MNLSKDVVWNWTWKTLKVLKRLLIIIIILFGAWYGFLLLLAHPAVSPNSALVMVWISVLMIILAIFPQILSMIKRFKWKDFEIELQDIIEKSTKHDFISIFQSNEFVTSNKGDFLNLRNLLLSVRRNPKKPVILVVNLKDGNYISIPMIFIYLFFLNLYSDDVIVLFIKNGDKNTTLNTIEFKHAIGAISGSKVLKTLQMKFSRLNRFLSLDNLVLSEIPNEEYFREIYFSINEDEFLSESHVLQWFGTELNKSTFDIGSKASNSSSIYKALAKDEEFLLVTKGNKLHSIISTCYFATNLSIKVITEQNKE